MKTDLIFRNRIPSDFHTKLFDHRPSSGSENSSICNFFNENKREKHFE